MKNLFLFTLAFALCTPALQAETFTLTSTTLGGVGTSVQEFNGMGCIGDNLSPQLSWKNIPEGTQSFAVTMYDSDAPTGSGFWHWVVLDIPADASSLQEGAGDPMKTLLPEGAFLSNTDAGAPGYLGPCPPEGHGFHTYTVTVYALKVPSLGVEANTSPALVGLYLTMNLIEKASLVFYYKR